MAQRLAVNGLGCRASIKHLVLNGLTPPPRVVFCLVKQDMYVPGAVKQQTCK